MGHSHNVKLMFRGFAIIWAGLLLNYDYLGGSGCGTIKKVVIKIIFRRK